MSVMLINLPLTLRRFSNQEIVWLCQRLPANQAGQKRSFLLKESCRFCPINQL
jgi:hypothetical protein